MFTIVSYDLLAQLESCILLKQVMKRNTCSLNCCALW